jgi:hypothetical protein
MLNRRGTLLIANFAPETPDIGFMECFMDWWLFYRDESQMSELLKRIPSDAIAGQKMFRDASKNIVFLEVERH